VIVQDSPALPAGWAPLSRDQQEHLLAACDRAPKSIVFCLTSAWTGDAEYRAYRRYGRRQLLAVGHDPRRVVATAIQRFSERLESSSHGPAAQRA
jgi:hypothetical protein